MPVAAYRAWVGFAKDTVDSYLTSAVAAAATSIPVSGVGIAASSTIFFIDGVNSESRAVTAGGGTSMLTVAATTYAHAANTPIVAQLTASLGPVAYMPVTGVTASDTIANLEDKGLRGSNVAVYNVAQGVASATVGIDGDVFADVFGYVLGSVYGAVDFAGGTPNTHTFAAMNTSASNGQPTPMLLFVYNGYNVRMYAGAKCSELMVKLDPAGLVSYTSKWTSFGSCVVANYTPSFSALTPQGAWQASASVGGTILPNILSADFTIKRDSIDAIQTLDGSQQPNKIWSGPLSTTGNMMATMEDDSLLVDYLANTQPTVLFTLINGTGATQVEVQIQMTKCQFGDGWKPTITGGKGYVEIGGPLNAVANVTDANTAGGGYSPSRVVLKNAIATGSYQ